MKKVSLNNIIESSIIRIIIGGLICILIPVLINKLILDNLFQALGLNDNVNRAIRVVITTVILMPAFYYFLFAKLEKRNITELQIKNSIGNIVTGFVLSVVIIGFSFILLVLIGYIKIQASYFPQFIVINIILILGFVITEEIFFRGILYRIVEHKWGTNIALISSALIFAILHLFNENTSVVSFLSVIAGGLVLGILYTYTKNLLVPIAFHFGWNLTQVLLGFGLSGGNEFSDLYIFKLEMSGNDYITGGTSGVENSVVSIALLFILFVIIYKKNIKSLNNTI